MKSNRSKATDISQSVRNAVLKRDNRRCIFCSSLRGLTIAHIISRSQGGLGVEENLVTACLNCHNKMDFTKQREVMLKTAKEHIRRNHGEFKEVVYEKDNC